MSDKFNDLEETQEEIQSETNEVLADPAEEKTQEEIDAANGKVSMEQNDNWDFDAEAPMLSANISAENFEFDVPDAQKPVRPQITRVAPVVSAPAATATKSKGSNKNDIIMFALTGAIAVVVAVILIVLGVRYYTVPNSDEKMNPGNVALSVDGTDVSVGMYNYYYTLSSQEYINGASNGYYSLDPTIDFEVQTTTDNDGKTISWAQKFRDDAIDRIKEDVYNYNCAVNAGIELTKDQKAEIKEALNSIKESATNDDKSVNEYIQSNFGEYCGYATVEKLLNQYYLGQIYAKKSTMFIDITDKEVQDYYKKNAENYQNVTVAYLPITFEAGDKNACDKAMKQAEKYRKDIKSKDDMKLLIPVVWKDMIKQYVEAGYYENDEACILDIANNMETTIDKGIEDFIDEALDWMFSDKTKIGDTACFSDVESGVVYIFLKTSDVHVQDDIVYSVRHILIQPEADEDADDVEQVEFTEAQWKAAEKKCNEVYAEYNKGEKTEEAFAELAEKYSTDTGSVSATSQSYGGIYSGVPLGQMVPEFEKWSVDDARKYGDTDIVKTDYGYHIMFFVDKTESYLYQCRTNLLTEKQKKAFDSAEVKLHESVLNKTKVAEPVSADQVEQNAE